MANVNVINKNNTDYYLEDTAGRNLVAAQQDTSLTAVQAYTKGDLFWYNNLLYKVKVASIASGSTITLATDADQTTVSAELKLKVDDNPTFTQASTRDNLAGTGETFNTILGKIKKYFADLKALAFIDTAATDPTTKYLRGDGQWITFPQGGHTMINNSGYESTMKTHALDDTDDDVASAYVIANWSNNVAEMILTTANKDDTGVGTWLDTSWESGTRSGWLWSSKLYHVLDDGASPTPNRNYNVEIIPVFDVADSEAISLYAMRIDDDVNQTIGGQTVHGGAVAFKFNGAVQNANGIKVGVKLVYQRTEVDDTGRIIS